MLAKSVHQWSIATIIVRTKLKRQERDPDPLASGFHGLVWVWRSHYKPSSVHHSGQGQTKENDTSLIPSTKKSGKPIILSQKKKPALCPFLYIPLSLFPVLLSLFLWHTHTSTNKSLSLKKPWLQRTDWETLPRAETATLLTDSNCSIHCSHPYKKKTIAVWLERAPK